jgi:hypothetical protein
MAQAGEAVAGLIEHERRKVVVDSQPPHTVRAGLSASERARAELRLVPVHPPVQLDVGQARSVDQREVKHRLCGRSPLGPPAKRLEDFDRVCELLPGHEHVDIAGVPHPGLAVQRPSQERSFQRDVRH